MSVYVICDGNCGSRVPLGMTDGWSRPHERNRLGMLTIRDLCPKCQEREMQESLRKSIREALARTDNQPTGTTFP